jgi:hypothetical protein
MVDPSGKRFLNILINSKKKSRNRSQPF